MSVETEIKALESAYDLGVSDFKVSLREEIEKEINELQSMIDWDGAVDLMRYRAKLSEAKYILQLLDTVKPKT